MRIIISNQNLSCEDLSKLLGVTVKRILHGAVDEEKFGVSVVVEAKQADITADHIAVIKEIYGGQTVELITEG